MSPQPAAIVQICTSNSKAENGCNALNKAGICSLFNLKGHSFGAGGVDRQLRERSKNVNTKNSNNGRFPLPCPKRDLQNTQVHMGQIKKGRTGEVKSEGSGVKETGCKSSLYHSHPTRPQADSPHCAFLSLYGQRRSYYRSELTGWL